MHKEILTQNQIDLLPLVNKFSQEYYLVGGTAIALHIGHRRSIDFDLFTAKQFSSAQLKNKVRNFSRIEKTYINLEDEYTILINGVKMTFFYFPYNIKKNKSLDKVIKMPDLLSLAAMKAFALGFRAKWKDYVDLFFIMKDYYPIGDIAKKAKNIFKGEFNERIFREQLRYFKDINYTEEVIYMDGYKISDKEVEKGLKKFSLDK